jgi:hypothetical protein
MDGGGEILLADDGGEGAHGVDADRVSNRHKCKAPRTADPLNSFVEIAAACQVAGCSLDKAPAKVDAHIKWMRDFATRLKERRACACRCPVASSPPHQQVAEACWPCPCWPTFLLTERQGSA